MDKHFMIFYKIIDGKYEPYQYGANIVPTENIDKVIKVPEEICRQAFKFDYDGEKLVRKKEFYVLTLEQLREKDIRDEISDAGGDSKNYPPQKTEEIEVVL